MKKQLAVLFVALYATALWAQSKPTAYVFEYKDQWTKSLGAAESLARAGFDVAPLPLDRSPRDAKVDLIFLGSFVSDNPAYHEYMKKYSSDLYRYAKQGHLLVQMTQADQTEATPPFLPSTLKAHRVDQDFGTAMILQPKAALLAEMPATKGTLEFYGGRTLWESFDDQEGFAVAIAADTYARFPGLMEGPCGKGRIVLAAMVIDKLSDDLSTDAVAAVRAAFFQNLASHAIAVRNGKGGALQITPPPLKPIEYVPGSWTLAVLPDTQVYAERYAGMFFAQTAWLALQRDKYDIKFVLQLGDITNRNTVPQWENARDALSLLDGKVPYAFCPGNHDYGPGGNAATRETYMNEYLPYNRYAGTPTFGGAMEKGKMDNTYHLFEAGGRRWIVIALEWAPRDATIAWANDVMGHHPDRCGILITHAYMNNNDRRYDHNDKEHSQQYNPHLYSTPGGKNDGQQLWDKLVRKHNFVFVFNGHVLGDGTGYLATKNNRGQTVHQILANYQMRQLGGEAYMRLLEFRPDGRTVKVKTYSPVYNNYLLQRDQQFTIELDR